MEEWQERVKTERNDLRDKIDRLYAFLSSDSRVPLSDKDRSLLRMQGAVMTLYCQILEERIDSWD